MPFTQVKHALGVPLALAFVLLPSVGMTADEAKLDGANTAWILTSTALVLFMTLPGLALFYGGLVRSRNVLSVLMHCFAIACVVSILWVIFVYGLAFGDGGGLDEWIGFGKVFLIGVGADAMHGDIPESVFFMFQMTFAIITPALIVGAYPERMRFTAVVAFSALWVILVYAPVTHWVWTEGGWLAKMGVRDFAGGLVVHTTAGVSALVLAMVLGSRKGFPKTLSPPHSPGMTMMGAAMLWVGWFGFNAGSALAADTSAGMAMTVTHVAAATAAFTWMCVEWIQHGKPTLIGIATGAIAGLATITPASGFVGPIGALIIGVAAGTVCYVMVGVVKTRLKVDDSLDVFAVHGVGGVMGVLMTSFLAAASFGGLGLAENMTIMDHLRVQFIGVAATAGWSAVLTFIILKVVGVFGGLRVGPEAEVEGLDITTHGEHGYDL